MSFFCFKLTQLAHRTQTFTSTAEVRSLQEKRRARLPASQLSSQLAQKQVTKHEKSTQELSATDSHPMTSVKNTGLSDGIFLY